jgi:hypothetical protein
MLLTIFAAASIGPSGAESATTEGQATERTAATFYEARYLIAGFLLRAGMVCQYQPKRMITVAMRIIATSELKAIAQGFPGTTKKWMRAGTGTFNDSVMTDGLLKACAHAMTVLEEAEQTARADWPPADQKGDRCVAFEEGQSVTLRGKIAQKATTEPEEGEPPYKYMVIELEDSICFKNAPDIKINAVVLTVAKKWVGRHAVVMGSMEGGLMWSINVSQIVDEKKVSR